MLDLFDPALLHTLVSQTGAPRKAPEPEDVKAGWTALLIWLSMAVAVALLGWSMFRRLRRVTAAHEAGVYAEGPATRRGRGTDPEPDLDEPASGETRP